MKISEKSLGFFICTPCTLNCKLCSNCVPLFRQEKNHYFVPLETYQREITEAFKIFDYVEVISITGGEPLLHNQLGDMVAYTLENFQTKFGEFRITTNGTMLPAPSLMQAIRTYAHENVLFVIDDYGSVSNKITEITQVLNENHVPYRINHYHGEDQHCGGWIDFGPLDVRRNYSEKEAQSIVDRCHAAQWRCVNIFKGKLHLCGHATCGVELGSFTLGPDEYVDLFDNSQPLEKKKEIVATLGKKPIEACYYCNGFDPETAERFPAGEQIGEQNHD